MGLNSPLRHSQIIDCRSQQTGAQKHTNAAQQSVPNRQRSILSNSSSSVYSHGSDPFLGCNASTVSSRSSVASQYLGLGHKRGISQTTSPVKETSPSQYQTASAQRNSMRQHLQPLAQAPFQVSSQNASPPHRYSPRSRRLEAVQDELENETPLSEQSSSSPPPKMQSIELCADGAQDAPGMWQPRHAPQHSVPSANLHSSTISSPDLQSLKRSGTGHFRTLSRLALENEEEFSIENGLQVTGLSGRRRLQRNGSVRQSRSTPRTTAGIGSGLASTQWMDKQRQFLQAYEYLCHIGEAKEWMEKVILHEIPPVIQLEETLRDGVTLAETVQALTQRPVRIFRNTKLQFRHSDNIAIFFNYLHKVELPDLFHFELVDLYEKKNIPKVIYCIHALSWLLFKQGIVAFRIGNLVGRLQFEDHELENMQRGLDQAGISMPSFAGVGASFGAQVEEEPEPVESEEQRQERELKEQEHNIISIQAQMRGAITRARLSEVMEEQWTAEAALIDLQARLRGDWARQIFGYRLGMRRFATNLQSGVRGYLLRINQKHRLEVEQIVEPRIVMIQSLSRAMHARKKTTLLQDNAVKESVSITQLQAKLRGHLQRQWQASVMEHTKTSCTRVDALQAMIRGYVVRKRKANDSILLTRQEKSIISVQAQITGLLCRRRMDQQRSILTKSATSIINLQAAVRGITERKRAKQQHEQLQSSQAEGSGVQAVVRGWLLRRQTATLLQRLEESQVSIEILQSHMRAMLVREHQSMIRSSLSAQTTQVGRTQAIIRGYQYRQQHRILKAQLSSHSDSIRSLQGLVRAMICRGRIGAILNELDDIEDTLVDLQSCIRGATQRIKFAEKLRYYQENMKKVIKIQSFIRGKQQGESYKSLTTGKNPPVGTIKNFVHLLTDSDLDFDEEVEFEHLRKTVIQQVRGNELAEQYINEVDIKIALLVKNKITLDEVIKHQKLFGGQAGNLLGNTEISSKDPFDLKALNKSSRQKLELYQDFFFLLQTQPQYLSKLFQRLKDGGSGEQDSRKLETLVMTLFGFAQKRREEYYLLKLIARSLEEEFDGYASLQDFQRRSGFWANLLATYTKSPRDRTYLRVTFGTLIKSEILENTVLDFESNPAKIYRTMISQQELRTGHRSGRVQDLLVDEAIQDPEVREIYIRNLRDLRGFADEILTSIEESATRAPFGIRMIAQQLHRSLMRRFGQEASPDQILQIVTQWLWKTYLQPALVHPEQQGVTPGGLSPMHRKSLEQAGQLLNQVASGKPFATEDSFLRSLNVWLQDAIPALMGTTARFLDVQPAEEYFDIDEFNDLYARQKPILYIKMADIFAMHHLIANSISSISPNREDQLHALVLELGSVKSNEDAMHGMRSSEISLTLSAKLHDTEDPEAATKSLFMETKRCVLYIIRVQAGRTLMEILIRPITIEDEEKWHKLLIEEQQDPSRRAAYSENPSSLLDFTQMPYSELKRIALENVLGLERAGRINRYNNYQDLLNAIAVDIRTKHRRRVQRQRELDGVKQTLGNLSEKKQYLDSQLQSYNNYIEQAMGTLQKQKGKKKFLMPFTKQYNHERELARQGRVVKFGSFKYSARSLADKGVLVFFEGWDLDAAQYDKINITIESEVVGKFHVEGSIGSMMLTGASEDIELDRLLQYQFENRQYLEMFRGQMKLNVNLFLHLIFKKFYRDE